MNFVLNSPCIRIYFHLFDLSLLIFIFREDADEELDGYAIRYLPIPIAAEASSRSGRVEYAMSET